MTAATTDTADRETGPASHARKALSKEELNTLWTLFAAEFDKAGISLAAVVVSLNGGEPVAYFKGPIHPVTTMLATTVRELRNQILDDITP